MWAFRLLETTKVFPQILHSNGRSPVCNRLWIFKSDEFVHCFPHTKQMYFTTGFSPVCFLMWICRFSAVTNDNSQNSHRYGFSPENKNIKKISRREILTTCMYSRVDF